MRNLIKILFLFFAVSLSAQTQTFNTFVKFKKAELGTAQDSVLVFSADGLLKHVPRSSFGGNFVPMSGTGLNKITGDLEFSNNLRIKNIPSSGITNSLRFLSNTLVLESSSSALNQTSRIILNQGSLSLSGRGDGGNISNTIHLGAYDGFDAVTLDGGDASLGFIGTKYFEKQSNPNAFVQLADLQNGYIPLLGTYSGNPITGNIEFESDNGLGLVAKYNDAIYGLTFGTSTRIYYQDDTNNKKVGLGAFENEIVVDSDGTDSKGIIGTRLFDKQDDPLAYVQKQDVDNGYIPLNGTAEDKPMHGTFSLTNYSRFEAKDSFENQEQSKIEMSASGITIDATDSSTEQAGGLNISAGGIQINNTAGSKGIVSIYDYSPNYSTNTSENENVYVQKKYVQNLISENTATLDFVPNSVKGQALGVATLDSGGKVPLSQINGALIGSVNYQGNYNASTNLPTLPTATGNKGKYYVVSTAGTQLSINFNIGDWVISNGSDWQKVDNNNSVTSVAGKVGAVSLVTSDVTGLQSALDAKINQNGNSFGSVVSVGSNDNNDVTLKRNNLTQITLSASDMQMRLGNSISTIGNANAGRIRFGGRVANDNIHIIRNIADNIPVFELDNQNASSTGNLIDFKNQSVVVASFSNLGNLTIPEASTDSNAPTLGQVRRTISNRSLQEKSTNYTLLNSDYYIIALNTITITTPTAISNTGKEFVLKNVGTGVVTISGTSSQTFDGSTSITVLEKECVTIFSDGVNWQIRNFYKP